VSLAVFEDEQTKGGRSCRVSRRARYSSCWPRFAAYVPSAHARGTNNEAWPTSSSRRLIATSVLFVERTRKSTAGSPMSQPLTLVLDCPSYVRQELRWRPHSSNHPRGGAGCHMGGWGRRSHSSEPYVQPLRASLSLLSTGFWNHGMTSWSGVRGARVGHKRRDAAARRSESRRVGGRRGCNPGDGRRSLTLTAAELLLLVWQSRRAYNLGWVAACRAERRIPKYLLSLGTRPRGRL
jgi:hypothetical protein